MKRNSIGIAGLSPAATPPSRMTWVYWEQLLADFGMRLDRFGQRASVRLGNGALIIIRLAVNQCPAQQPTSDGWMARDFRRRVFARAFGQVWSSVYSLAG